MRLWHGACPSNTSSAARARSLTRSLRLPAFAESASPIPTRPFAALADLLFVRVDWARRGHPFAQQESLDFACGGLRQLLYEMNLTRAFVVHQSRAQRF